MDEDAQLVTSEDRVASLEPTQHRNRVLNLQKAARDATSENRADIVLSLIDTYRQISDLTSLQPYEWELYCALSVKYASGSARIGSEALLRLFDLHHQSTLQFQSPSLFRRYISFVLAYFSHVNSVRLPFLTPQNDSDTDTSKHTRDPASEFLRCDSCPRTYSATGTYELTSLPPIDDADDEQSLSWKQVCGVEEVRARIREAYSRCAYQLQESQSIWHLYISFELAVLASGKAEQQEQLETVKLVFLARLRVPHAAVEQTFQAFSSFVTEHLPPHRYEEEMSAANTLFAQSRSAYQNREQYEDALVASQTQLAHRPGSREDLQVFASHWKRYLSSQQRRANQVLRSKDRSAAQIELELTSSLFERAIVHFGLYPPASERDEIYCYNPSVPALEAHANTWKRLTQADKDSRAQTEQQVLAERLTLAESIWIDYIAILTSGTRPDPSRAIEICSRSTRVLPTSVQLYATGMRQLARFRRPTSQIEQLFEKAASPGALVLNSTRYVDLCLARLDCEREIATYDLAIKTGNTSDSDPAADIDKFTEIYAFVSYAISKVATLTAEDQDTRLRLETFACNWIERTVNALGGPNSEAGSGFNELAEGVWQSAIAQQPENPLVYRLAAAYWTRRFDSRTARSWFKAGFAKLERNYHARASGEQDASLYEALLQDWLQFEHQYGSVQDIEAVDTKIRSEREKIWEAWYAASSAYTQQDHTVSTNGRHHESMAVDGDTHSKGKRKASDDPVMDDDAMTSGQTLETQTIPTTEHVNTEGHDTAVADTSKRNKTQEGDKGPARDREHCSVLVANLAPDTDAAAIRSFLRGCGRIVELSGPSVLAAESGSSGEAAALVEFSDASGASSARTRNQKLLADRRVSIHLGWQCTLFVTNFPEQWEDADIRRVFGAHGNIFTVRWPSKRFVSTRRFCYVQFTNPASAEQAVSALDKQELAAGRAINVALSDPARRKGRTDAHENTKELFVSGLPRSITEEELKVPFEEFGVVTGVRLLRTPDGKLRGLGFVDFAQTLDAQRAMRELNSTKLRGKTISVVIAENRGVHGAVKINKAGASGTSAEQRARSAKVYGLPDDAQEALIQQAIERSLGRGSVKTVFWTPKPSITGRNAGKRAEGEATNVGNSAVIEFPDLATAGKAVLMQDLRYGDEYVLQVSSMDNDMAPHQHVAVASPTAPEARDNADLMAFVPRASRGRGRGRGRGGLGFVRPAAHETAQTTPMEEESLPATAPSGQDRFREMLKRG